MRRDGVKIGPLREAPLKFMRCLFRPLGGEAIVLLSLRAIQQVPPFKILRQESQVSSPDPMVPKHLLSNCHRWTFGARKLRNLDDMFWFQKCNFGPIYVEKGTVEAVLLEMLAHLKTSLHLFSNFRFLASLFLPSLQIWLGDFLLFLT